MIGKHFWFVSAFHCLGLATAVAATAPASETLGYRITPEPEWADPMAWDPPESVPENELDDGVYYFLVDETELAATGERFGQFARQIANEYGAQNGSEIQITFDPSYQSVDLHRVDVLRDGKWQSRLDPSIVTVLQREQDMERFVLDGSQSLVIRLPDIRPGDVIAYAFTRRGNNPVMGNRFYRSFSAGSNVPWKYLRQRIITEPVQKLDVRGHATALTPTIDGDIYEWKAEDLPVTLSEESVPEWVSVYPWIEASAWGSWADVVQWAIPLYPRGQPLPDELEKLVSEWGQLPSPADQAAAALRFTQDQVRYLAVASGIHSHQPRPPSEVAAKRFGDCKEKVLLLMHLLDRLGIENYPVFVNTSWYRGVEAFLPSPYAFDHVILEVVIDGESYFVDPTRTAQRGPLEQRSIPDYGFGLRARDGEDALIPVRPRPESKGRTRVVEHFVLSDTKNQSASTIHITTTHEGANAESARRQFAETSLSQLQKQYLDFYAERYPSIEAAAPLRFSDDAEANRFVIEESYTVPALWQPEGDDSNLVFATIYQDEFGNRLSWPRRTTREWPYRLNDPVDFSIETTAELPEPWPSELTKVSAGKQWFDFKYERQIQGSKVQLTGHYRTKVSEVPPDDIADYRAEAERAYDEIGYYLTSQSPMDRFLTALESPSPNFFLINVFSITLAVCGVGGVAVLRRDRKVPPLLPSLEHQHLDGLRGWLILVAIGLVLSPVRILIDLGTVALPWLDATAWQSLTQPGSAEYHPSWGPIITFTSVAGLVLLSMSIVALVLFFKKSRRFPPFFIAFSLSNLLVLMVDYGLIFVMPIKPEPVDAQPTPVIMALLSSGIWISYMLLSKRVKATFRA